jgi:putative transposase
MTDKPDSLEITSFPALISGLRDVFTVRNWRYVLPLALASVIVRGRKTVTNLVRACHIHRSYSGFHRFFSDYHWFEICLARKALELIQRAFSPDQIDLVVDDTFCMKHRGHTDGICLWTKQGPRGNLYFEGHTWVVIGLNLRVPESGRSLFFPLLTQMYIREEEFEEPEDFRTRYQIAGSLIQALTDGHSIPVQVIADGNYATRPFLQSLRVAGATFVGRLRKDARLYDPRSRISSNGRLARHGPRLPILRYLFRGKSVQRLKLNVYGKPRTLFIREFLAYWPSVDGVVKAVAVKGLPKGPALLFSTNTWLSAQEVIEIYASRWKIEIGIRDAKQFMSFGKLHTRKKRAITRQTNFLLVMQSFVQLWYLKKYGDRLLIPQDPWYPAKTHPSYEDMLKTLRRELVAELIHQLMSRFGRTANGRRAIIRRLKEAI